MKTKHIITIVLFLSFQLFQCQTFKQVPEEINLARYPRAEREFRAAWVATVANINWPSQPGLSTNEQKKEAIILLDLLKENNFNAVIFQVRPQCDALYKSDLEPWSYYLTGEQGKAPDPYYDPLQFWVEQAHARGLELHAWLNPYRAHHPSSGAVTPNSVVNQHPELVVKLKNGYWWLDPSKQKTQDYSLSVVIDIVRRYDIDGIHFDDYFYPYPSYNNNEDFPDQESWQQYIKEGGKLSRGDWRRKSVNTFIKNVYEAIKKEKLYVKFGLSPFGIWRPHHPESIEGFDQFDQLYADARLWLHNGWIDYYTPQLYWSINQIGQSYPVLLGWWSRENIKNRHLWPGISLGRRRGSMVIDETINQIMITRGMIPQDPGNVHWSIGPLLNNQELVRAIVQGPYKHQALVPSSPWLNDRLPQAPDVNTVIQGGQLEISWSHIDQQNIFRWVIYYKYGNSWDYTILNGEDRFLAIPLFKSNKEYMDKKSPQEAIKIEEALDKIIQIEVTAVDRLGNESLPKRCNINNISYAQAPSIEEITSLYAAEQEQEHPKRVSAKVKLGIEVLVEDQLDLIQGKRIGLITNPSAVGSDLRSDIDILANTPGVNLVALFGAEHGVRGAKQGRIMQEGELDPLTGIPVYSLYGDTFAPKKEWLDKLDMLIFDIQGVGAAWYTFKYSMSYAMEACAKAGIPFMVLDRPNPLGGLVVEGPYLDLANLFRHRLPLRHGMTYGELATMWNETEGFGADLTVIKMKGWRRSMTWDDTGLLWVMPSPNMGTFETAVVYPGQCLFERMNVSEGRGTTKPFLLTGAPWVNAMKAAADLNSRNIAGAIFRPAYFIPRKLIAGANPRGKPWNKMCGGVEIMLTDYKAYRSVETALHIIDAYRKTNPDSLSWSPPAILKQLEQMDMTVGKVIENCQLEISDFIKERKKYLLYR